MKQLQIGEKITQLPIIQGGMGVGVSLSGLASAVANRGGIGVISGVQIGFREPDFMTNTKEANIRALRKEIRTAREKSPLGILGVNLMVAIENYADTVKAAVEEKIDLIISGAGLPNDLPGLVKGSKTKIAPIVSSGKAAAVITKLWIKRHNYFPELIIIEGPLAGGHLGFSKEVLSAGPIPKLEDIFTEVKNAIRPFEEKAGKTAQIVVAGGIYNSEDIKKFLDLGADGVQMGTRFVATEECDAHNDYKMAYVNADEASIDYIVSPVGMPGQAIMTPFIEKVSLEREKITKCYNCLSACNPATTPYCITSALVRAVQGDVDNGLVFIGKRGYLVDKITTVDALMDEFEAALI
ncbi:NAD(P)H-dependent flavin oxidoreductase [Gudongella sp. SC589]|uniref:NAD(P)H-dependent flavin oxidoreductase n=1 Tax=Gudongella sp. SC589 TaxID=3385990 RepID=UPI003904A616